MKKQTFLISVLLLVFFSTKSVGQDTISATRYEYMTIVSEFPSNKLFLIYITRPSGEYEKLKFKNKGEFKYWQTTKILEFLELYSESGWVVKNSNLTTSNDIGYFYYLLERKKNNCVGKIK